MPHILIPNDIRDQLLANGAQSAAGEDIDPVPVVKLFTPDANATWLLTELDAENEIAFGLCCLGMGSPELGYMSLNEIASVRGPMGLPVERDAHYRETRSLSVLAKLALRAGHLNVQLMKTRQRKRETRKVTRQILSLTSWPHRPTFEVEFPIALDRTVED
jgi:Protein of unknown function (DUF2958)